MVFSAIPQVITEDRASGAQVFEGSLAINNDRSQYLRKAFSGLGNTRTFTWSSWVRRSSFGDWQRIFTCEPGSNLIGGLSFTGAVSGSSPIDAIRIQQQDTDGNNNHFHTNAAYRDTGWYHIVMRVDTTSGTPGDRLRLYVNGELQSGAYPQGAAPGQNSRFYFNRTNNYHEIGHSTQYNAYYDGRMTQCYWIDGQSLGPENFGFSDSLTGTWRPKKYEQLGPNNGTTWSSGTTAGSIEAARPWALGFDGREDTFTRPTSNQMASIMFDTPINFSSKFEIKGALDSGNTGSIEVYDGTDAWINVSSSFGSYAQSYDYPRVDITSSITSPVKGIRFNGVSAVYQPRFTGIYVDDQILIDGDTSNMGRNGFYLPMDGSAPIGKDQSGRGNDWTSINIGGSVELPKATGAIPILDTNEGGNVAKLNARTDSKTYTVTEVGGKYHLDGVQQPILNAYRGGSYTFDYTAASGHPFYLSGMPDGKHNSKAYSVSFDGANGTDLQLANHTDLQVGSENNWTIEFFVRKTGAFADYDVITGKGGAGQYEWFIEGFANGQVRFLYSDNGTSTWTGNHLLLYYMNDNQWYHFAAVRNGTSFKMYVDGIETFSTTGFNIHAGTDALHIGGYGGAAGQDPPVQISNYRIVKGTSVYTSNFRRPGTTLENINNTKLLCCHDSSATTATVAPVAITSNGGVSAIQTHQPFLYNINGQEGVNTGTSNTTKITIPHYAADTLYYYCQNHSGMGSSINVTTDLLKADPYAWKCVLALPLDGSTSVFRANDVRDQLNCNETAKSFTTNGNAAALTPNPNFYGTGGFAFDGNGDYLQTAYDEDFNFGSGDFTVEAWAKSNQSNSYAPIVGRWTSAQSTATWDLRIATADFGNRVCFITRDDNNGNGGTFRVIDSGFNANDGYWHHIAASRTGDTIKIFIDGIEKISGSYPYKINTNTGQPLRVGYNDSHYFDGRIQDVRIYKGVAKYTENFAPASTDPEVLPDAPSGIPLKTKLKEVPTTDGGSIAFGKDQSDYLRLGDDADTRLTNTFSIELFYHEANSRTAGAFITDGGGSTNPVAGGTTNGISYQFYHNAGGIYLNWSNGSGTWYNINNVNMPASVGWHHVVVTNDNSRTRMFIDGVIVGGHSHHDWGVATSGRKVYIGTMSAGPGTGTQGSYNSHGYMSNIRICNGSVPTEYATTATASGTKVFNPPSAPLTTTSQGANSSHVKLLCAQSQTSATTATVSPSPITKFNNVYASKFSPFTDDINIIRGQASGYATFNPLQKNGGVSLSNGNLKLQTSSNVWKATQTTIGMKTGKFYWEFGPQLWRDNNNHCQPGVAAMGLGNAYEMGGTNYTAFYHYTGTSFFNGQGGAGTAFGAAWNDSEHNIIGIAFDADTRKVWFSKNGIWQGGGNPSAGTNEAGIINLYGDGTYAPTLGSHGGLNGGGADANFGQKPFKFPPPDGFQPLNLSNVQPEKVIVRPEQYVNAIVYTGSGGTKTVSGLNFKSDLIWHKGRTVTGSFSITGHSWHDTVRGKDGTYYKELASNTQNQENLLNNTLYGGLSDITHNGFTVVDGSDSTYKTFNGNGNGYVAWCWKAGGSKGTFNVDDVGYANASDVNMNAGDLNSSVYDQSQNWTNNVSSTSNITSGHEARLFNGILSGSNADIQSSQGTSGVINFTSAITGSKIEIYTIGNVGEIGINGSNLSVTANQWVDTGVTSLTSVETRHPGAGSIQNPTGLKVDGKILIDSGLSVTNVPSVANTGCSVGTKQGFSIVAYDATGSNLTVNHGLSKRPGFIILKSKNVGGDWLVWHQSLDGVDRFLKLNDNSVPQSQASNVFISVDENTFGTGNDSGINSGNQEKIAYIWHDVPGLQKFGIWNGNGSADGPFVETGFRPAIILYKDITSTGFWNIKDSTRTTYNGATHELYPATSDLENHHNSNRPIDFLSNGFKIRSSNGAINDGSRRYIYAAWAEAPSVNLYGAQANAR